MKECVFPFDDDAGPRRCGADAWNIADDMPRSRSGNVDLRVEITEDDYGFLVAETKRVGAKAISDVLAKAIGDYLDYSEPRSGGKSVSRKYRIPQALKERMDEACLPLGHSLQSITRAAIAKLARDRTNEDKNRGRRRHVHRGRVRS